MPTVDVALPTDADLLRAYALGGDAGAFGELAGRHVDWIYSAALRMTGSGALAEDVTQGVLLALAQKAGELQRHPSLGAWLFRATRFGAQTALRGERRRKVHEGAAMAMRTLESGRDTGAEWEEVLPRLDAAIAGLAAGEREVILLRFYQQLTLVEVGRRLGISEEAARKRVDRAVGRLRRVLGMRADGASVSGMLAMGVVRQAPAHLHAVASAAGLASPGAVAVSKGIHAMAFLAKLKIAVVVAMMVTVVPLAIVGRQWFSHGAAGQVAPAGHGERFVDAEAPIAVPDYSKITNYFTSTYELAQDSAGTERLIGENLFDVGHGSLDKQYFVSGRTIVSRDDGVHAYRYRNDSTHVVQKTTDQPAAMRARMLRMLVEYYRSMGTARRPELDIHGPEGTLRCYEAADPVPQKKDGVDRPTRHVWLDAQGLPRQLKTVLADSVVGTTRTTRTEFRYNAAIPAEVWNVPSTLTVIDPRTVLRDAVSLKDALFVHESVGQMVAVHGCVRDGEGNLLVMCSTRLTAAAQKAMGSAADHFNMELQPAIRDDDGTASFHQIVKIASLESPGVHVVYFAIRAAAVGASRGTFTLTVDPMRSPQDLYAQGAPKAESTSIDLAVPAKTTAVSAWVDALYPLASSLDGFAAVELYERVPARRYAFVEEQVAPGELSKEAFLENLRARLGAVEGP
jgi:RNA polymerase sigma factor (sigma-70 family)